MIMPLIYTLDYPFLYLTGEGETRDGRIYDDGSFTLYIDGDDLDNSCFVSGMKMLFVPEE